MPTLRDRVTNLREGAIRTLGGVTGEELRLLRAKQDALDAAIHAGPWWFNDQHLIRELDTGTWAYLQQQQEYEVITSFGGSTTQDAYERERMREVEYSRYLYRWDTTGWSLITITTDFSIGQQAKLIPADTDMQKLWQDFVSSPDNDVVFGHENLIRISDKVLADGEVFFILFVSEVSGEVQVRYLPTEEITAIAHAPHDRYKAVLYQRTWTEDISRKQNTLWYPDWRATKQDIQDTLKAAGNETQTVELVTDDPELRERGTSIKIIHMRLRDIGERGWPLLSRSRPWCNAYANFLQNRVTLSKAVATFIDDVEIKGGQRAISDYVRSAQSSLKTGDDFVDRNPPPVAGSEWVHNQQSKRQRMPLTTGAGDAATDGMTIVAQAGAGARIPAMWLGRSDSTQNRATAEVTMLPSLMFWTNYAELWGSCFRSMLEVLAMAKEGGDKPINRDRLAAEFSTQQPLQLDLKTFCEVLNGLLDTQVFDLETVRRLVVMRPEWGFDDPDKALDDIAKRIETMQQEEEKAAEEAAKAAADAAAKQGTPPGAGQPPANASPGAATQVPASGKAAESIRESQARMDEAAILAAYQIVQRL